MVWRTDIEVQIIANVEQGLAVERALSGVDEATKRTTTATRALVDAFGPRFVGNVNQAIAANVNMGKALQNFVAQGQGVTSMTAQMEASLGKVAAGLQASAAGTTISREAYDSYIGEIDGVIAALQENIFVEKRRQVELKNNVDAGKQMSQSISEGRDAIAALTNSQREAAIKGKILAAELNSVRGAIASLTQAGKPLNAELRNLDAAVTRLRGGQIYSKATLVTLQQGSEALKTYGEEVDNVTRGQADLLVSSVRTTNQQGAVTNGLMQASSAMGTYTEQAAKANALTPILGQAMVASFSASSAAAGNFEQAIFGLGFSFLFLGDKMADPRFLIAAAAFSAIQIGIRKLKNEADKSKESFDELGEASGAYGKALQEAIGPTALAAEGMKQVAEQAREMNVSLQKVQTERLQALAKLATEDWNAFRESLSETGQQALRSYENMVQGADGLGELAERLEDIVAANYRAGESFDVFLQKVQEGGVEFHGRELADIDSGPVIDTLRAFWEVVGAQGAEEARIAAKRMKEELEDEMSNMRIEAQVEARIDLIERRSDVFAAQIDEQIKAAESGFDTFLNYTRTYWDNQNDIVREGAANQIETLREGSQNFIKERQRALQDELQVLRDNAEAWIDARRDALDAELDVISAELERETDAIRDALDDQLDAIKDKYDERVDQQKDLLEKEVDGIREALDVQLDEIKDGYDRRKDYLKDVADAEIEANKERIDALREQEKELQSELSDMDKQRQDLMSERLRIAGELAGLDELQRRTGGDPALAREIAMRQGALVAIQNQEQAISEQTQAVNSQISAIEGAVEAYEEQQDVIKSNLDAALEAIDDEEDAAIKSAKKIADEKIKAAKDASDNAIKAINDQRDAEIEAAKDAADAATKAAKDAAQARKDAAKDAADYEIEQTQRALDNEIQARQRALDDYLEQYRRNVDGRIKQINRERDDQITANTTMMNDAIARETSVKNARVAALNAVKTEVDDLNSKHADQIRKAEDWRKEMEKILLIVGTIGDLLGTTSREQEQMLKELSKATTPGQVNYILKKYLGNLEPLYVAPHQRQYQWGGTVPGPLGQPYVSILHGGERVISPYVNDAAAGQVVNINISSINMSSPTDMAKLESAISRSIGRKVALKHKIGAGR